MRWALPFFLVCVVCLPGAANAVGDVESRGALVSLPVLVDQAPSWSADGTRIGFTRLYSGFGTISADGSDERWIARDVSRTALSPDGEWFAFVDPIGLWTIRADGTQARFLLQVRETPVWSPDSRRLAFRAPDGALWVVDRDGSGAERLAASGADPTWSPDGAWIAFATHRAGDPPRDADLMVVSSSGGMPRAVVQAPAEQVEPRWSPDGTLIAYLDVTTEPPGSSWRLHVVRPDGSGRRAFSDGSNVFGLAWMPDSRRLAVESSGVFLRDVESGLVTMVAPDGVDPAPSPDGTLVAFSANGDCFHYRRAIHVVRVDGTQFRRLTNHCRIVGTPGRDELRSSEYPEELFGLGGDDRLYAEGFGTDGDTLDGGAGNDRLVGDHVAHDDLRGGPGNDVLLARSGFDTLTGGAGRDRIGAGIGRDRVYARDGERDTIFCGTMLDRTHVERSDRVWADHYDVVSPDCDIVYRPPR